LQPNALRNPAVSRNAPTMVGPADGMIGPRHRVATPRDQRTTPAGKPKNALPQNVLGGVRTINPFLIALPRARGHFDGVALKVAIPSSGDLHWLRRRQEQESKHP
jgi:hypothetical protein